MQKPSISSLFQVSFLSLLTLGFFPAQKAWAGALEQAIEKAQTLNLAETPQWKKLIHYERGFFGFYSQQGSSQFYYASPDHWSPAEELSETLRAFFSNPKLNPGEQHPLCRFPARFQYLKKHLDLSTQDLPPADCSRYEKFKSRLAARSVSVVFSSYYLNNPSSAFGHTFLRLNRTDHATEGNHAELLDSGVNYAAVNNEENVLVYAIKGIIGAFPGSFTSYPYYFKVREYNEYESRDLWSYDLNLTQDQVDLMVAHAWELGSSLFYYYYFTQNCSYHVLGLLDVADPHLQLIERNAKIIIPSDTIHTIIETPGLLRSVHFRPSVRRVFEHRASELTPEQNQALKESIEVKNPKLIPQTFTPLEQAQILDTQADYVDFKHNSELIAKKPEPTKWMQEILHARSSIPIQSEPVRVEAQPNEGPHLSHKARRISLDLGGNSRRGAFSKLSYRFSLHDLTDLTIGYPTTALIEMGRLDLRFNLNSQLTRPAVVVDDFTVFQVKSFNPLTQWNRLLSWQTRLSVTRFYDGTCQNCLGPMIGGGAGWSWSLSKHRPSFFFLMGNAETAISNFNRSWIRVGVGPELGMRISWSDHLNSILSGRVNYYVGTQQAWTYQLEATTRWALNQRLALNAQWLFFNREHEVSLGLSFYH